jgi:hypothetical protein
MSDVDRYAGWQTQIMKRKKQDVVMSGKRSQATGGTKLKAVASSYPGFNSMVNWLAGLLLILSFLYSDSVLDAPVAIR